MKIYFYNKTLFGLYRETKEKSPKMSELIDKVDLSIHDEPDDNIFQNWKKCLKFQHFCYKIEGLLSLKAFKLFSNLFYIAVK